MQHLAEVLESTTTLPMIRPESGGRTRDKETSMRGAMKARPTQHAKTEFRRVTGRKLTHPSTSEMDYTPNQLLFMQGVEDFKKRSGRQFPTLCEILAVAEDLGWKREEGWPTVSEEDASLAVA